MKRPLAILLARCCLIPLFAITLSACVGEVSSPAPSLTSPAASPNAEPSPAPSLLPVPEEPSPSPENPSPSDALPEVDTTPVLVGEIMGITEVKPDDVESIRFIQNRESQMVWVTSNYDIIEDLLDYFNNVYGVREINSYAGGYMDVRFNLKSGDTSGVGIVSATVYVAGEVIEHNQGYLGVSLNIPENARTREEWESILAQCERER